MDTTWIVMEWGSRELVGTEYTYNAALAVGLAKANERPGFKFVVFEAKCVCEAVVMEATSTPTTVPDIPF